MGQSGPSKPQLPVKLCFVALPNVNKAALLNPNEAATSNFLFTRLVKIKETEVKFEIWDTASSERYRSVPYMCYRDACSAILMYDITKSETFDTYLLTERIKDLRQYGMDDICIILVGNNCHLEHLRQISEAEGKEFAKSHDILFLRSSPVTIGIDDILHKLGERILDTYTFSKSLNKLVVKEKKSKPNEIAIISSALIVLICIEKYFGDLPDDKIRSLLNEQQSDGKFKDMSQT